jgi:hypothetical protein
MNAAQIGRQRSVPCRVKTFGEWPGHRRSRRSGVGAPTVVCPSGQLRWCRRKLCGSEQSAEIANPPGCFITYGRGDVPARWPALSSDNIRVGTKPFFMSGGQVTRSVVAFR